MWIILAEVPSIYFKYILKETFLFHTKCYFNNCLTNHICYIFIMRIEMWTNVKTERFLKTVNERNGPYKSWRENRTHRLIVGRLVPNWSSLQLALHLHSDHADQRNPGISGSSYWHWLTRYHYHISDIILPFLFDSKFHSWHL